MDERTTPRSPRPEHDHGRKSEQEARTEGEHGWGYGGRPEEQAEQFAPEDAEQDHRSDPGAATDGTEGR